MSDAADLIGYYDASLPPELWSQETPTPKAKRVRSAVLPLPEVEETEVEVEPL